MHYLEAKRRAELVERKAMSALVNLVKLEKAIQSVPFAEMRAARIAGIKDILLRVEKQAKAEWKLKTQPETFWVALTSFRYGSRVTNLTFILTTIPPDLPREETASARLAAPHRGTLGMPYSLFREVLNTLEGEVADGVFDNNLRDDARSLVISRFKRATQARTESLM